jgi:protein TonB
LPGEQGKGMFIQIGLVVALSIVLVAFEWTKGESKDDGSDAVAEIQFEDEMMQITRREEPKPEPKPEQPKVAEVLDIVDDDVEIEDDFDFDMEATDDTEYDFTSMIGDDKKRLRRKKYFTLWKICLLSMEVILPLNSGSTLHKTSSILKLPPRTE